jgi:uncharacterized protein GlcG (DUF336 family)
MTMFAHRLPLRRAGFFACGLAALLSLALVACSGGGGANGVNASTGTGGTGGPGASCDFNIASEPQALTAVEVERLVARAVEASTALGAHSTIAVVDRVGNVLATYRMTGAGTTVDIRSGRNQSGQTGQTEQTLGLDGLNGVVGSDLAAIAKAITGAYLSSSGNAFSTRTASGIVQEHFPATIARTAGGPLFGVQFSQLPCGDLVTRGDGVAGGPHRSPLGLAADPGGFPIYKNGRVVGGIGVMADGVYGLDPDPTDIDTDLDERIAQSALGAVGEFAAPSCIRADRITAGGISLSYSDADATLVPVSAASLADPKAFGKGTYIAVPGYIGTAAARDGTAYGGTASGVAPDSADFAGRNGYILVDAIGVNRYPPMASLQPAGGAGLSATEVREMLSQALGVAHQARAQIRRPVGAGAEITASVVDAGGNLLGLARTSDAPLFGTDVSLQKARTAAFFSSPTAGALLAAQPDGHYVSAIGVDSAPYSISGYALAARGFFGSVNAFSDGIAFTPRSIGNIARPYFPDGIDGMPNGPFSKPSTSWSVFNVGLQLDVVYARFIQSIVDPADAGTSCTASGVNGLPQLRNGIQVFPGAVPIYRNGVLIGAIGVSGDGVDQDDMVSILGLARAADALHTGIGNAPAGIRADTLQPQGVRLRYVQCPQAPFNDSDVQNVCSSL